MAQINRIRYGSSLPAPRQSALRAGPLALIYEGGDLRYLRLGDTEVIRRIYVAVRDRAWNTIAANITQEDITTQADSFEIHLEVRHRLGEIDFFWSGHISGQPDGSITYALRGEAASTFWRNRIGFCVLHPLTCAGGAVQLEHVSGACETAAFPLMIAPQVVKDGHPWPVAPFSDLRAVSHQALPGLWANLHFEGEAFEMEDQRNWSDASFKTYGTPLAQPYPVEITAGTEVNQTIRLTFSGQMPASTPSGAQPLITFLRGDERSPARRLPLIGLSVASHEQALDATQVERLAALRLAHLRVDVHLARPDWLERLSRAAAEAQALHCALEVAVFVSASAQQELLALQAAFTGGRLPAVPVARWLIFHENENVTNADWLRLARRTLGAINPAADFCGGSKVYFTELNTNPPACGALDALTFSINPQVHAFDNASLTETLACQAQIVASAHAICPDTPLVISPITLKPRFNPNAHDDPRPAAPGQLPPQVDVRQSSLYGLAWTLGSLKYLAESGVRSVTYYETTGWRGVMELASGSPLPEQFYSIAGGVFPIYHLLADLAEMPQARVIALQSSHPLQVDGLLLADEHGHERLWFANFTPASHSVRLIGLPAQIRLRMLNEDNGVEAMRAARAFRARPWQIQNTQRGTLELSLRPFEMCAIDMRPTQS